MLIPQSTLQTVQTWQRSDLAQLMNSYVAMKLLNKKFNNFQTFTGNLGATVLFDVTPYAESSYGLAIQTFSASQTRTLSLTVCQAANSNRGFDDQTFLFTAEQYMERFSQSNVLDLGAKIEMDLLKNFDSTSTVLDPRAPGFGGIANPASGPYRFYGDGVTPINSVGQLNDMKSRFNIFGAANWEYKAIIPEENMWPIVNTSLNQFVTRRNDEYAMDWEIGSLNSVDYFTSNLLPIHVSGTVGNAASPSNVLTVVSTNDPTGANITQITLSGATNNDPNAILIGDLAQNVVGGVNFVTFFGQQTTILPLQIRSLNKVLADGSGNVVVNIYPALKATPGTGQNINKNIVAGMQFQFMPSHKVGILMSGNQFYGAMPKLPDSSPYEGNSFMDEKTGASIRHYWGMIMPDASRGYVWDTIWGSILNPDNCMRICFPLT